MSHECGAETLNGGSCRRKVRGEEGNRCPFHTTRNEEQCSICLSDLTGPCKTLPCGHVYHRRCISQWSRTGHHTCPYCREPFEEPPQQYRVTVTIENLRTQQNYTYHSNVFPEMIRQLGIVNPNSLMTEVVLDVDSQISLREVLNDLGVSVGTELF